MTLKENFRGRFLRINEDVGGKRNSIMIPSISLKDIKHCWMKWSKFRAESRPRARLRGRRQQHLPTPEPMTGAVKTFREACCSHLEIPAEAYEETVLFHCLPARHKLIGKLMWRIDRFYFEPDLKLLQAVANCTSMRAIHAEISYHHEYEPESGFPRKVLKARMSGQLLVNFASKLLPQHG